MTICMTNGGIYNNVRSINNETVNVKDTKTLFASLKKEINNYEFIIIEYVTGKALIRTSCISSINI